MVRIIFSITMLLLVTQLAACASPKQSLIEYQPNDELVVLAHGLGRSDLAMWRFAEELKNANYKVCRLDYATIGQSVDSVLAETTEQIGACIIGAPKVHFVGHSLGGLVIRAYLQDNKHKLATLNLGEVVLIGTPNKGSELADHLNNSWLMEIGGGISQSLVTGSDSLGNTIKELEVNIGVIAGTKSSGLTREKFKGPNDGLVSVESAKLDSMSDFIALEVGHSQMRYDSEVINQTIHFLQKGTFKH